MTTLPGHESRKLAEALYEWCCLLLDRENEFVTRKNTKVDGIVRGARANGRMLGGHRHRHHELFFFLSLSGRLSFFLSLSGRLSRAVRHKTPRSVSREWEDLPTCQWQNARPVSLDSGYPSRRRAPAAHARSWVCRDLCDNVCTRRAVPMISQRPWHVGYEQRNNGQRSRVSAVALMPMPLTRAAAAAMGAAISRTRACLRASGVQPVQYTF